MQEFAEKSVQLEHLLLDPNNYRFQDSQDFVLAVEDRFHEESVQDVAAQRLRADGLQQLKNSIAKNGFLPVERLVVREYPAKEGYYVVVEGNRRLASLKWLKADHDAGADIDERVVEAFGGVPVLVVGEVEGDPAFFEALMGIRHVSGIKEWGGYQRAKLVMSLRDTHGLQPSEVSRRLGLSTKEVNRRYRAIRALQQMEQDEEFGEYASSELFPIFMEIIKAPTVKDWLGWDEDEAKATNEAHVEQFYALLCPREEEEKEHPPKIRTGDEARYLKRILESPEATEVLFDSTKPYLDAVAIVSREEQAQAWVGKLDIAISALSHLGWMAVKNLSAEQIEKVRKLESLSAAVLSTHEKLVGEK